MQHTTMLKKQKFSEGKQEITRRRYALLHEKVKEAEEEKMREQKNMLFKINDIMSWGLWSTIDQSRQ